MFELWESEAHLAAWRAVAKPPRHVTPILAGSMQKYQIAAAAPPFG